MDNHMEKLTALIETLVAEKSLSFEVLEQLNRIKNQSIEVIAENKRLTDLCAEYLKIIDIKTKENIVLSTEIGTWKERESSLVDREKAVLDIEHKIEIENMKTAHAVETLTEIKTLVGMVFKNVTIRQGINKSSNIPVSVNGQIQNHYTSETYNKDQTEE